MWELDEALRKEPSVREPGKTDDIATELARQARDGVYVAVGLGVLGLQRARALRHELGRQQQRQQAGDGVSRLPAEVANGVAAGTRQFGEWLSSVTSVVSEQLAPIGDQVPEPAREVAERVWRGLEAIGSQLRQLASPPGG